jgi:hypothetical protein
MNLRRVSSCVVGVVLLSSACSGDEGEASSTTTTSTSAAPVTSIQAASSTTTTTPPSSTVTTTSAEPVSEASFPEYTIVFRETGTDGDTVVVLLDADSYSSLTDIDLQNVVVDVVEKFPPIVTVHIIDDTSAAEAVLATDPTTAEQELLDRHYFVRLEEGFRLVFTGQFADNPPTILGS